MSTSLAFFITPSSHSYYLYDCNFELGAVFLSGSFPRQDLFLSVVSAQINYPPKPSYLFLVFVWSSTLDRDSIG